MAAVPIISAAVGVAGTVANMQAQNASAASANAAAYANKQARDQEAALINLQRKLAYQKADQEAAQMRIQEGMRSQQNLFDLNIEELRQSQQEALVQHEQARSQFELAQQGILQTSQAAAENIQAQQQLFQIAGEGSQAMGENAANVAETRAAQIERGQDGTQQAIAGNEQAVLQAAQIGQQAAELLSSGQASAEQQRQAAQTIIGLQQQMGLTNVQMEKLLGEHQLTMDAVSLAAAREANDIQSQANLRAIDYNLAAQKYSAASSANSAGLANQVAQSQIAAQMSQNKGSGLAGLAGLAQQGIALYGALQGGGGSPQVQSPVFGGGFSTNLSPYTANSVAAPSNFTASVGRAPLFSIGSSMPAPSTQWSNPGTSMAGVASPHNSSVGALPIFPRQ